MEIMKESNSVLFINVQINDNDSGNAAFCKNVQILDTAVLDNTIYGRAMRKCSVNLPITFCVSAVFSAPQLKEVSIRET